MPIDVEDMILVHRAFRREFDSIPDLIAGVALGDTFRAKVVADHMTFMIGGLHHHHAAEDELVWPVLLARVPTRQAEIERMEAQHVGIAAPMVRLESDLSEWRTTADQSTRDRLLASVADLTCVLVEHLDDEERIGLPIIEEYLTEAEWQATVKRGASFLSKQHPRMGIVLSGLVLEHSTPEEQRRFLSGVPFPLRLLVRLFGPRMTASYRRRLYALP
jgi:iron-sulfur cluster repair protein YtfE (RIC family)